MEQFLKRKMFITQYLLLYWTYMQQDGNQKQLVSNVKQLSSFQGDCKPCRSEKKEEV